MKLVIQMRAGLDEILKEAGSTTFDSASRVALFSIA